jgi:hypothetical protein
VAHGVFLRRVHLAERCAFALGHEHRIVAETLGAARRPDQAAAHLAAKSRDMPVGPGERQHRDEAGAPVAGAGKAFLHQRHGLGKIALRPGPARGIDAGRAVERRHDEAGIIGERRQPAGCRRGQRLELGICLEGGPGLFGFGQGKVARPDDAHPIGLHQRGDLAQLARVVGGDDQTVAGEPTRHVSQGRGRGAACR